MFVLDSVDVADCADANVGLEDDVNERVDNGDTGDDSDRWVN